MTLYHSDGRQISMDMLDQAFEYDQNKANNPAISPATLKGSSTIYKNHATASTDSLASNSNKYPNISELVLLPNEHTHAYSYNPLSPNSLLVRLSILKRSLEIMIRNPWMLTESQDMNLRRHSVGDTQNDHETSKYSSRMAALSAYVNQNTIDQPPIASKRPTNQRTSSLVVLPASVEAIKTPSDDISNNLRDLLKLLDEILRNQSLDKAPDLHNLSLLNINKLCLIPDAKGSRETIHLKRTLLDSLAEPIFDHYRSIPDSDFAKNQTDSDLNQVIDSDGNTLILEDIKLTQDFGRILHPFVSSRNSSPQAVFTCAQQDPWNLRAANDLACLTFGISNQALKALSILDLIHSDSRNFVLNKLLTSIENREELIFTGEVIPIIQPGHSNKPNLIWASLWAKSKNGLLVCMFEKAPCDYFDVLLNLETFEVESVVDTHSVLKTLQDNKESAQGSKDTFDIESNGKSSQIDKPLNDSKKQVKFLDEISDINKISSSLGSLIQGVLSGAISVDSDDFLPPYLRVLNHVNETRYFTLKNAISSIPCAVSASVLETGLKLKIHSLPYQAGLFIVDSHSYEMMSFNKSISKNMFGYHFKDIVGKSLNILVPSFSTLIEYLNLKYPSLDVHAKANRGLVLSEHFFRKLQAHISNDQESFYTSVGIEALHSDGCSLKVDLQISILNSDIILVWITQSRDVIFENYSTNPSQLSMLNESELEYISSSSSYTSLKWLDDKMNMDTLKQVTDILADESKNASLNSSYGSTHETGSDAFNQESLSLENNSEYSMEENAPHQSQGINQMDDYIKLKIERSIRSNKDKSQFAQDSNFRLDESLILKLNSSKKATTHEEPGNFPPLKGSSIHRFLYTPESELGAQKHTKKFSDFEVLQDMGEGAYGKVRLCLHTRLKYIVVIKMIFKERILVDTWVRDRKLGTIPSEIQILSTLNKNPHDNIVGLIDFFEDDDYYYIEQPAHGETGCIDLFDIVEFRTNMTEYEAKLIFKQIADSVHHLHDRDIVHRDIKDENVIIDAKGFVKLIDFGSAAYVKKGPFDVFVGTIDYAAPEVLGGLPYDGKPQDIWAIGVLLYTIIFKENPFYNVDEILEGTLKFPLTKDASPDCISLIKKILNKDVLMRPTINEICEDKWLQI